MAGRKPNSIIRKRIATILDVIGSSYGYEIYKTYSIVFGKTDMRLIYYHLKSGAGRKEFIIKEIKKEKGGYTWGDTVERVYYDIGPAAEKANLSDKEMNILNKLKK
jgi:hypothetical protein